ncbi:hypothetical protein [Domibacillus antri]|uniref:hypothetical protein n=1 Tax=Domibacillus antri TaxID=1714264 RepID=UPI0009F91452|nr:hypothetical protein [Domibacillus antri]
MVMIQSDFYDERQVHLIVEHLHSNDSDDLIKSFICEWLQTKEMQKILLERPSLSKGNIKTIIKTFITIVGKHILNQEGFTWENYCKIQHEILSVNYRFRLLMRQMIRNFYLYTLSSELIINEKVKKIIEQYSYLLLSDEFTRRNKYVRDNPFILNNITTYFPLDSTVEQVIQAEYILTNGEKAPVNFFIHTKNKFIFNIMESFVSNLSKINYLFSVRLFIASFEDSLRGLQINRLEDFGAKTFKIQLIYLKSLFKEYDPKARYKPITLLVKFYRYIDDLYLEEHGNRLFTSFYFNRDIITHMHYQKSVEEGYEIVNLNSMGNCPRCHKWFVVADIEKNGTHIANLSNFLLDFELVHNTEIRKDLKDYIWNLDVIYKNIHAHFSVIRDFINEADAYYQEELKVLPLRNESIISDPLLGSNERKLFSSRFIIYYYASLISNEEYTGKTINTYISIIHLFMKHIQHKYNISGLYIEQFSQTNVEAKGGTPISVEDFREIYKEFKARIRTEEDELLLILFQLTIETKLRTGEILGLERDCIESIDESGTFGTIRYYSKTTDKEYKREVFIIEHIRLIEKAIHITKNVYRNAESSLRKFIFIGTHPAFQNKIIKIGWRFYDLFIKTIDYLFYEEKIKVRYKPNSLRDTYIERAWQMVEDGLISTLEVGVITGNSAKVAARHYRDRENTKRYVEALYEVTILDEELPGEIVENETAKDLPPVQEDAGNCASESCIKVDTDEDSFYRCLTCKKFVTTIERSAHFERKMKEYKSKGDNATSIVERNFYTGLMELYGGYLIEMYAIMGAKK